MIKTVPEKYTLKQISIPTTITSEEQYDRYVDVLMSLDRKGHLNPSNTGAQSSQTYRSFDTSRQSYSCTLKSQNNALTSVSSACTPK